MAVLGRESSVLLGEYRVSRVAITSECSTHQRYNAKGVQALEYQVDVRRRLFSVTSLEGGLECPVRFPNP